MTLNMKQFRIRALNMETEYGEEDSDESDAEGDSPAAIKKRHQREIERAERENRENTSALLELRDLEDELKTLQKLFETQETTIKQMKEIYSSKEFDDITKNGQYYLDEALEYLDEYRQQTAEMLRRVDTTRNDVSCAFHRRAETMANDKLTLVLSMRKCLKWCSGRPRSTRSVGPACRRSWRRARTSRS